MDSMLSITEIAGPASRSLRGDRRGPPGRPSLVRRPAPRDHQRTLGGLRRLARRPRPAADHDLLPPAL